MAELLIPRRATSRAASGQLETRLLSEWRSEPAYVLLGDPGAGKSTSFEAEFNAEPGAVLLMAADIADEVASPEGRTGQIVYIDGLDQIKAGSHERSKGALSAIRRWLARAKPLGFRISCREADWLGEVERDALARVAPGGSVSVLQLEPLSEEEGLTLLRPHELQIGDARAFWLKAEQLRLNALFGNPLLLKLWVEAVIERNGQWPETREEAYQAACQRMVGEASKEHATAIVRAPSWQAQILDTAGLLCALLLLSGRSAVALQPQASPQTLDLSALPPELELPQARAALATKLFVAPGGLAQPRHRSIAEYLAAKALAARLNSGLPLERVLALMLGHDGHPVEALRGVLAWLTVAHMPSRSRLLQIDPIGFVLNGDPAMLTQPQRLELLQSLSRHAADNPWFRGDAWRSDPFGALVTTDMAAEIEAILAMPQRDQGHQAFIDCVLDALQHADPMPGLAPALAAWVEDAGAYEGNRVSAMQGWQRHCPPAEQCVQERRWLKAMKADQFKDPSDRLLGVLLYEAYPDRVGPDEVLDYLQARRDRGTFDRYDSFWQWQLLKKTRPGDAAILLDRWLSLFPSSQAEPGHDELRSLSGQLLSQALTESGDSITDERLYEWLDVGLDKYGLHTPVDDSLEVAISWLGARPERLYAVLKMGFLRVRPEGVPARRHFWRAEARLLGVRLPEDYPLRLLREVCAPTSDAELARYAFAQVVNAVVDPAHTHIAPSFEDLEVWAADQNAAATPYVEWLAELTSWPLDHWQGEQYRHEQKRRRRREAQQIERRQGWSERLLTLSELSPDLWLIHQVAKAMRGHLGGLEGKLPEEKVLNLLGSDAETAQAAMAAVHRTLTRPDLPPFSAVLALASEQRVHLLLSPALIAADHVSAADHGAPLLWSEPQCQTLAAFYLVGGFGELPFWFRLMAQARPEVVAPVLLAYALPNLADLRYLPTFAALLQDEGCEVLTAMVLPRLLQRFPGRVGAQARQGFEVHLLPALSRLPLAEARALVSDRLADESLSPRLRLCWLVADLRYRESAIEEIQACVASSRPRRLALAESVDRQGILSAQALPGEARVLKVLIEELAPLTPRRTGSGPFWVGPGERREDLVRALFNRLAQLSSRAAHEALRELAHGGLMNEWQRAADYSLQAQRSVARQASFVVAEPAAVALTLANRAPAHAADLKAVLLDLLAGVLAELRGANDSALRMFWRDDGTPQDENVCRDRLLTLLRPRLEALGVTVDPEAAAADQKRMDLKLSFARPGGPLLSLPVEAKKDRHPQLWTAWREQLQRLYANDPRADGQGVYLVFWFNDRSPVSPSGARPTDAHELRRLLEAEMDEQARQHIGLFVLDLSQPAPTPVSVPSRRRRPVDPGRR